MQILEIVDRNWRTLNKAAAAHVAIYRATNGRLGQRFLGSAAPMLLLDHVGARSGVKRTTPLVYLATGSDLVLVASKSGHPNNPAWYHNLLAHPETTVQVGRERRPVRARPPPAPGR